VLDASARAYDDLVDVYDSVAGRVAVCGVLFALLFHGLDGARVAVADLRASTARFEPVTRAMARFATFASASPLRSWCCGGRAGRVVVTGPVDSGEMAPRARRRAGAPGDRGPAVGASRSPGCSWPCCSRCTWSPPWCSRTCRSSRPTGSTVAGVGVAACARLAGAGARRGPRGLALRPPGPRDPSTGCACERGRAGGGDGAGAPAPHLGVGTTSGSSRTPRGGGRSTTSPPGLREVSLLPAGARPRSEGRGGSAAPWRTSVPPGAQAGLRPGELAAEQTAQQRQQRPFAALGRTCSSRRTRHRSGPTGSTVRDPWRLLPSVCATVNECPVRPT